VNHDGIAWLTIISSVSRDDRRGQKRDGRAEVSRDYDGTHKGYRRWMAPPTANKAGFSQREEDRFSGGTGGAVEQSRAVNNTTTIDVVTLHLLTLAIF